MKYGWININITDMWNKPKYNSERLNQLLFSDFVRILDESNKFYHVKKYDDYVGWVDKRFVEICSKKDYQSYTQKQKYVVSGKSIPVSNNLYVLLYGTTFKGSKLQNSRIKILLPNKNSMIISSHSVSKIPNEIANGSLFVKEAKRFLGNPYLWGGVSSFGLDCSGLTQTILKRFGVHIPRDTKDQIHIGKDIARKNIKTGDLLFFNRHVGFAIGKKKVIHSSIGGGGVRINSLVPNTIDYREDLDKTFKTARRIF